MTRSAAVTVRRPGARTTPATRIRPWRQTALVKEAAKGCSHAASTAGTLVGMAGGFKWSSQHLDGGGCDEGWETALGSGATSRVAGVAWPTRRGAAGEPAAVLGGDCGGAGERGRGGRGRRVARAGGPLVPGGGRDVTQVACAIREATLRAVSGVR